MSSEFDNHQGRVSFASITLLIICITFPVTLTTSQQAPVKEQINQAVVGTWPVSSKRFALIIGVDSYQDPEISNLSGASNDAKAIADALKQYAGFPGDQVVLLTSNQSVDLQPTRATIIRRLSNLRLVVPKDGLLWVSFAGHGIERDGHAYLLPMDAQLSSDIDLLEDSAINVQSMRDRIRQTGVGQVIFVLDACRNNPLAGRGISTTPLTNSFTHAFSFDETNSKIRAFATVYATGAGQVAHEYKQRKQGYFTSALVEGLKGAARNGKGEVTLSGLVKYVQEVVPKRVALDLGPDKQQSPWADIQGYKADELVVALAGAGTDVVGPKSNAPDDANTRLVSRKSELKPTTGDPITGNWTGTYGPGSFPIVLRLKLEGQNVKGELQLEGSLGTITSGTWDGEQLSILASHNGNRIVFKGVLNDGRLSGREYLNGSTNFWLWSVSKD
jgi:hypothetical protein